MLLDIVKKGSTDRSVLIRIIDDGDGTPETGVEHNTTGIDLWYRREGAAKTSITEVALAALTTAHAAGGIEHVGDGYYRLDLPDAAFATGANYVDVGGTVTDMIVIGGRVRLVDTDIEVANIPANITQFGGSNGTFSGGRPEVNATHWGGTAVASALVRGNVKQWDDDNVEAPDSAGRPHVHVVSMANDSITDTAAAAAFVQEVRNAITGGAYALSTDANGRMRIVDGTGAGELDLTSGLVALADGTLTAAKFAANAITSTVIADSALPIAKFGSGYLEAIESAAETVLESMGLDQLLIEPLTGGLPNEDTYFALLDASVAAVSGKLGTPTDFDSGATLADNLFDLQDSIIANRAAAALADIHLDHLMAVAAVGSDVADSSIIARLCGNGATPSFDDYSHLTNSLAALSGQIADVPTATENRNAITGGAYPLDTDANGRMRIVDGTGAGEISLTNGALDSVLALGTQAKADVNAEIVDALNGDTYAEPAQGTPPATASIAVKLGWLYTAWRNQGAQDADEFRLFADDGTTVLAKRATSDDGTTYTAGELTTGA
jgi:hypothetical protein